MNTKLILVGAFGLILGLSGGYSFAQSKINVPVKHDMNTAMNDMTSELENKSGAEFEQAFIDDMIAHHEGAVAMAQMVLEKSQRPELVQLANDIISAQATEINQMKAWNNDWFGGVHHTQ